MFERRPWSQDELLVVFQLYCQTSFGRLHQHNPDIIKLAQIIGRTPGAVAMKACNFASMDPVQQNRQIRALGNVSRADKALWESFTINSEAVAEQAVAAYVRLTTTNSKDKIAAKTPDGPTESEAVVKIRRVQSFFRTSVLVSYDTTCALTGIAIPELLNASHIIPWSVDSARRADPRNGICLNAFHDRAFDRGLITFDTDCRVVLSPTISRLDEPYLQKELLQKLEGQPLRLPSRFMPDPGALDYHRNHVFRGC